MTIITSMCTQLFSCPLCTHPSFDSLDSLRIGLVSVATRPLSCPICNDTVLGLDKLTIHLFGHTITDNHRKEPVIIINETSKSHSERNHNQDEECVIPGQFITTLPLLFNGTVKKIDLIPQSCDDDDKNVNVEVNLLPQSSDENHVNKFHDLCIKSVIKCDNSKVSSDSASKEELNDQKSSSISETTSENKRERCNICGLSLANRNSLILHKQLAHKIAAKDCNIKPEDLLKNYPCHLCSKVFKMRGSLMIHMRVAHTGGDLATLGEERCSEGGFNCPLCGKNFKKEQHVTQHLKTHEGKQWECDVCSKMFTTKYFLKKHKRLHSGEMPYQCNICYKTFTFQQSYHKHRLYHKDDKPHMCTACGRSFKELSTLHNHERIHTGEKPFACETCGKCFRQRVSYLVHRRIHTGVMPYTCSACGKSFRYKVSQRTHKCPGQSEQSEQIQISTNDGITELNTSENQVNAFVPSSFDQANKFVVIPNSNGEPTLTREIDVNPLKSGNIFQFNSDLRKNDEKIPSTECKSTGDVQLPPGNSQDFFSLVMSPMQNDPSSPATEMQHLRLASPKNPDNFTQSIEQFPDSSDNLQKDLKHAIDGILSERNRENNSLGTINEESLKELLYGIDKTL